MGRRTLTNVAVVWIEGITNREIVEKMKARLSSIEVDGLLSPASVEEYVTGSRLTPFPLLQYTERSDRFCQGLLDGRVGLLVDGLPLGYLAPATIGYLMESPEDRSRDAVSASCIRILRYGALVLSLLLPAVYIAMVMFHRNINAVIRFVNNRHSAYADDFTYLITGVKSLSDKFIHLLNSPFYNDKITTVILSGPPLLFASFTRLSGYS